MGCVVLNGCIPTCNYNHDYNARNGQRNYPCNRNSWVNRRCDWTLSTNTDLLTRRLLLVCGQVVFSTASQLISVIWYFFRDFCFLKETMRLCFSTIHITSASTTRLCLSCNISTSIFFTLLPSHVCRAFMFV